MKSSGVIRLLRELVAIPSVNPQGDPGTDRTGEGEIAKFVAGFLRRLGADVELQFALPGRPTVIGKFSARGRPKRAIGFGPHTDTVSVKGMTINPFKPVVRGNRLWGRGAADTKGSLAAFLWAMKRMAESRSADRSSDIYLLGLMGEESGNEGVKRLMQRPPKLLGKLDFVVVGEPTRLEIVTAHKGVLWVRVTTRGRSCHASMPASGENAIYKMSRLMQWLQERHIPQLSRRRHPVLGSTTMNVGTIRGGSKVNIVPDWCEIEVDYRTLPSDHHGRLLRQLRLAPGEPEIQVLGDCSGLQVLASNPVVSQLVRAGAGRCVGASWFSDAAIFAQHGVPAVAFGPGSIAQAHTCDEFTSVSEVERCAVITENFLTKLA